MVAVFGLVEIGCLGHALFVTDPVGEPENLTDELEIEAVPQMLSPRGSSE